jgi:DNA-binding transcriptional ArsR family regulator
MSVPVHQAQADLFRTLGHPVRVRILELLQGGDRAVRELLAELDVEPANLSQQLAILRRAFLVTTYRREGVVMYALAAPAVNDVLSLGQQLLTTMLTDNGTLLAELAEPARPCRQQR